MFRLNIVKNPTALFIITLIVVGFFVYSFNLNNQLFWDDDDWIINNNFVHTISWDNIKFWLTHNTLAGVGLQSNYYRPFLFFTFALNWVISEAKPFLWHLVSNSIHIANAVIVFLLLNMVLTTSDVRKTSDVKISGRWVAFLTALIFVIHPLNTEAVSYIAGRGDPLSVFFMLLALYLWINDIECRLSTGRSAVFKILSLTALVLAILSRETGIIFPALLMVFYVSFISKDRFLTAVINSFKEALPYFAVVAVYGILRLTVLNFQNTLNFYITPNLYSENLIYRLFTFIHVLVDYFRLLFVPIGLHMERSVIVHTSLFQWPVWLGAMIVATIIAVGIFLYRKNKLAASDVKVWFFGWGWFFVGLAMVSGITPINAEIYEHWLYLPMIGFWVVVAFYLVKLFDFLKFKKLSILHFLFSAALVAYLFFFSYQSIQRNLLWGNSLAFYLDILKYEPDSVRINNNVGNIYYNKKDMENAEKYYKIAASQGGIFAQPNYNLGTILQARGDIDGAIKLYEKAIEIDPNFYYPYQNLAVIYAQRGNFSEAAENIEKLKLIIPNNPRVYYNSALVYIALNNKEKARQDVQKGLELTNLDPGTGKLLEELARELSK
ncbi:MAG: tetratricopeptide repeat protein [Patescibacteria group bacterium]